LFYYSNSKVFKIKFLPRKNNLSSSSQL